MKGLNLTGFITAVEPARAFTRDGKTRWSRPIHISSGQQVYKYYDDADTEEQLRDLSMLQMISVSVTYASTNKGVTSVSGELETL